MKLAICSDLHLDHYKNFSQDFLEKFDPKGIDALIVAGDLSDGTQKEWANGARTAAVKGFCEKYPYVFMVMGNHDYYGSSFHEIRQRNADWSAMFANLVILEPGMNYLHEESGTRIAGGTLWYPDNDNVQMLKSGWPDFKFIHDWPVGKEIFEGNKKFREEISDLNKEHYPDIIVSHMVPTPLAIHKKYIGDPYNAFFVSDETELINKIQPKLWVAGHTHHPFDIMINKTRLYINPRAYPNEGTNPNFFKRMTVEI